MLHKGIPLGDQHFLQNWEVADEAARLALVVTNADIGKMCRQLDTGAFHLLLEDSPMQWEAMGSTGEIQTVVLPVKNNTGVSIPAGSPVYVSGAAGALAQITLADADAEATSSKTIGLTKTAIANGATGYAVIEGRLTNIDTSAFAAGDLLYLSAGAAGTLTTVRPSAPNHAVFLGYVIKVDAATGIISVHVQNGNELEELHNVDVTGLADGMYLKYDAPSLLWKASLLHGNLQDIEALSYTGNALMGIRVNAAETAFEFVALGGGGVTDHTALTNIGTRTHAQLESDIAAKQDVDTQLTSLAGLAYTGNALKVVRVNAGETDFELATPSGGGGLTNYTESLTTAAPNATVNTANLVVTGGTTNTDAVIKPKGTGALLANIPDNLAAGGNKRGIYAVDFSMLRNSASDVASGAYSVISGGRSNRAGGDYSVIGGGYINTINAGSTYGAILSGTNNTVFTANGVVISGDTNSSSGAYSAAGGSNCAVNSGTNSFCYGLLNTIAGTASVVFGERNTSDSSYCFVAGFEAHTKTVIGKNLMAAGKIAANGDAQSGRQVQKRQTTDATPIHLYAGSSSAAANSNTIGMTNNQSMIIKAQVVGKTAGAGDMAAYEITAIARRGANAAATVLLGTPTVTVLYEDAGAAAWDVSITANTTTGAIQINVTGAAATTINWAATVDTTEVTR